MKKRQIVNIINFIRALEPRTPVDMVEPVREHIRMMKENNLRGTFLIQYDALLMPEITELLKPLDKEQFEIGVWYEIVKPQVEAVGLKWTGRYPWDWHIHCGFPMGYCEADREKLADELFRKFREVFGYYPKSFGSWMFDTHTVTYINDKYGLDALCNCRDQCGTDGYTMWGGYYGQGYYPSKRNVFVPARDKANQIDVPIFRMLGVDPLYQYDYGMDVSADEPSWQRVITLEPCCAIPPEFGEGDGYLDAVERPLDGGGGNPKWFEWYMRENFNGECLSFGYAQAGQENSFGWQWMKIGLDFQYPELARMQREGLIEVEPLRDTGLWYKKEFSQTPASAISVHNAYNDDKKKSVWYCTRNYRVNLFADDNKLRIRDIHINSDEIADPYTGKVCPDNVALYETLPFIDGFRYTGRGILAGGFITFADGSVPCADKMEFTDMGNGCAMVEFSDIRVELSPDGFKLVSDKDFTLEVRRGIDGDHVPAIKVIEGNVITLSYADVDYKITVPVGEVTDLYNYRSVDGAMEFKF